MYDILSGAEAPQEVAAVTDEENNGEGFKSEKKAEEQKKITKAYQYYMEPPNEAEANQ